jgi:cytochrome oxidase Cu insertion factor (SCO1/SenC/PrrC family)
MVRTLVRLAAFAILMALCASAVGADAPTAKSERRSAPVGVGDIAPDFSLEDQDGRRHTLSAQRGRTVVLVFYRGYW